MGSRARNSTRAARARSVKRTSSSRRRTAGQQPDQRIPAAIQYAIEDQRGALSAAMSILYCLHSELRRQTEDVGSEESDAVKDAVDWVDLADVTSMLLVQLHSIHLALDSVSLRAAKTDRDWVMLADAAHDAKDSQP